MNLNINGDRLLANLETLAEIGKLPGGGVCRLAFSFEDRAARQWVRSRMTQAGMTSHTDAAGNIIGRYDGLGSLPALATGSHIDTVAIGGKYDGALGVLAGIELVETLRDNHLRLQHPIEVMVFSDEERSVIGSKAMAGELSASPEVYVRADGRAIQTCLAQVGGAWEAIATAQRTGKIAAFVELHVEQGGILEELGAAIGIVTGVVGQYRFSVQIEGCANHAGTTPMNRRRDALLAAAQVILAVNQLAVETPGDQVATVGHLTVSPNATNTIAQTTHLHIDLRDLNEPHLETLAQALVEICDRVAADTNTEIAINPMLHIRPTLAHPQIMAVIEQVSAELNLRHHKLPSRAGHDAQEIGRIAPMGMIFVPSQAGISHSAAEFTSELECIQGANVLLQTFLQLDHLCLEN